MSDPTTPIRDWVRAANDGLRPWSSIPEDRLAAIGRRCGPDEVAAIIALLDELSQSRADLPAWDGDSYDDIGKAQAMYMHILGAVDAGHLAAVAAGLRSGSWDTRGWVTLALERHGAPALPALHAARDAEPDANTRQFMTEAVGRLEAGRPS
jgi:hypothetical protein